MLSGLNQLVVYCYQRAGQFGERAARTDDFKRRAHFLECEQSWLLLARSYQISDTTSLFLNEMRRRILPKPLRQKVPACSSCHLEMISQIKLLGMEVIFVCPNCRQLGVGA